MFPYTARNDALLGQADAASCTGAASATDAAS